MDIKKEALDKFGRLLVERGRDSTIQQWDNIVEGRSKAPIRKKWGDNFARLSPEAQEFVHAIIPEIVDSTLHYMLWMLEDPYIGVKMSVETSQGIVPDINEISPSLGGHPFSEYGWIARFSKERLSDLE